MSLEELEEHKANGSVLEPAASHSHQRLLPERARLRSKQPSFYACQSKFRRAEP